MKRAFESCSSVSLELARDRLGLPLRGHHRAFGMAADKVIAGEVKAIELLEEQLSARIVRRTSSRPEGNRGGMVRVHGRLAHVLRESGPHRFESRQDLLTLRLDRSHVKLARRVSMQEQ